MQRVAVLTGSAVFLLAGQTAAEQTMTSPDRYRADRCAGRHACDETGGGITAETRVRGIGANPNQSAAREVQRLAQATGVIATTQTPDDKEALAGLTEVKVAFDITTGEGKGLLSRLRVIDETRQSLIKQGVKPNFVLAFRGPATKLVQTDVQKVKAEDLPELAKIAEKIKELSAAPGVHALEQCSVAIRQQGTAAEKVLRPIKVVGNSWISLMAYQAKGYSYIAP